MIGVLDNYDLNPPPEPEEDNCYSCKYRKYIPGDCHIGCNNIEANVIGDMHGIRNGWFMWPYNFDPVWLKSCDGFERREEPK